MKILTIGIVEWLYAPLLIMISVFTFVGCTKGPADYSRSRATPATRAEVIHFCGDCHAYPRPETFPIHIWRDEVEQGYVFYDQSNRNDLTVPDKEAVVAYYEQLAPEGLRILLPDKPSSIGPLVFEVQHLNRADALTPAIAHISQTGISQRTGTSLVVSDMREGQITLLTFESKILSLETIADIPFPAHVDRCDLDSNGEEDWLVADLGSYAPADHIKGQLVWLKFDRSGFLKKSIPLLTDVGRVADTRTADFDQDGDLDILVAIFGWRKTGKLLWLEQVQGDEEEIEFKEHLLDNRHGCSHIPLADIDGDGDIDIVALFSQEFESVDSFVNNGNGRFQKKVLYMADDPSYGSSSIELADVDGDGDFDVLYTNGDSLDSHLLKPYHSVQLLEQKDGLVFDHHHITDLPGAYCVKAGDIDGDGDLDLVASTMTLNFDHPFHSLIWLEQRVPMEFLRHNLETSLSQHACLLLEDLDSDGDLDIAVGHFEPRPVNQAKWLSLWWNEGKGNEDESADPPGNDSLSGVR
ncbi:MAG: VCBS repeat-containing protein [Planctomicrobium sp.]|jgi:hypothetical protein|nr:VCBS repeat-containing protein [Planctomicrobium sp.]